MLRPQSVRGARGTPDDVEAVRLEIESALNAQDERGRRVGNARHGVYAFFDYDGEPIYVGQTAEQIRTRVRRHLTNQRTDAVAMNVLDPFEVADVEMWPFWDLAGAEESAVKAALDSAEFTVYRRLVETSRFGAVLNEAPIPEAPTIDLPPSVRRRIVPPDVFAARRHPDVRIARRAATIAKLAQVISERSVQPGLRTTLLTQAKRLEHLAGARLDEVRADEPPALDAAWEDDDSPGPLWADRA
jgi:hypothetical protein